MPAPCPRKSHYVTVIFNAIYGWHIKDVRLPVLLSVSGRIFNELNSFKSVVLEQGILFAKDWKILVV